MVDYNQLVNWIFFGVVGFCFVNAVRVLGSLKVSIDELNIKMATIITRITYHEKSIEDIKQELNFIRKKG